jgi:hypothetical protein
MTSRAVLSYTPGCPFARMARVAIREWALPVEEAEVVFPPPPRSRRSILSARSRC